MPYTKTHKNETRQKILKSAFELFSKNGFNGVTIDLIMNNCRLTRGAFYAHFSSKSDLYNKSLEFSATSSRLSALKPNSISDKVWLGRLLDEYLSIEHVNGTKPCPLAFLATDIVTQDLQAKETYATVYQGMNEAIVEYSNTYTNCNKDEILSLTAMIIGAVAIARTIKDQKTVSRLLTSCRLNASKMLDGV